MVLGAADVVGPYEGRPLGWADVDGRWVGDAVGGAVDGAAVGPTVGDAVGAAVTCSFTLGSGNVVSVGSIEGTLLGAADGSRHAKLPASSST